MSAIQLIVERMPRPLLWATLGHACLALLCLAALGLAAAPITGVHPALKPLKFAVSIAIFLGTLGVLLPSLSISPTMRTALSWLFVLTMVAEIVPIVGQSIRGTTSHFNTRGSLDAASWRLMMLAIVVATIAMASVTFVATLRPLVARDGEPMERLMMYAWRAGLWLLLLTPVSGFAMGGRLQHSVGGVDGGSGLPFVNWSTKHGDLRVAHFFALHALQIMPLVAWLLSRLAFASWVRWGVLSSVVFGTSALCIGTLAQAFAGRPFMRSGSVRPMSDSGPAS